MLLCELTDADVAGAFVDKDPKIRHQNNSMSSQQLIKTKAAEINQNKQSKDPLTQRIESLRAQLAQLIIQRDQIKKTQANRNPQQP